MEKLANYNDVFLNKVALVSVARAVLFFKLSLVLLENISSNIKKGIEIINNNIIDKNIAGIATNGISHINSNMLTKPPSNIIDIITTNNESKYMKKALSSIDSMVFNIIFIVFISPFYHKGK